MLAGHPEGQTSWVQPEVMSAHLAGDELARRSRFGVRQSSAALGTTGGKKQRRKRGQVLLFVVMTAKSI
jgi:hypothetical protein